MKTTLLLLSLILFTQNIVANSDGEKVLQIEKDGMIINVVNFEEGDKIKLFEVETGEHILSKTRGQIDLSFLPVGRYLVENNEGLSVVVERTDDELAIEDYLTNDFVAVDNANVDEIATFEDEYKTLLTHTSRLEISQKGNIVNILNFEEGDKIKLFEVKNIVHILTKTTPKIDLELLSAGRYLIENNRGFAVVIEKVDKEEEEQAVANF
ncbi:hypothetical protein [Aquimarina intermedia]|uniref:Secreted protein (Por secretion system target) n=1 Tax=Aquimarina intermedia TaxID=350814 RepID=A0A5S5BV74_9FLAO|nr:hypothetical protein [Aquimarina intermedia]TYP70864.1 hypothetical protein BD809_11132 [Aquimarina intermedia]